jgi:aspartyl protease family protein
MSPGMLGVIRDALGWVAAAALLAFVILNFEDVRALNRQLLGIPDSATPQTALAQPASETQAPASRVSRRVELTAGSHGHYAADAEINGRHISLMVDTGASLVVLTYEDAERAGIFVDASDFNAKSQTANGIARNALVTLDEVCVESVCVNDVKAMVAELGRLHVSLLGMTYLGRLGRVDMQSGRLTLEN